MATPINEILEALRSGQLGLPHLVPPELLVRIVETQLEPRDIVRLCQTSRQFNQMFCQDPLLWRNLYRRDYGVDPTIYGLSPENYRDLYFARTTGHINPHLQALISELVRLRLGIDPTPDTLRAADPDVFTVGFLRKCQRPFNPIVISSSVFNRERGLIKLLQDIFEFRTLEYRGNYYLPRFIINIQQGPVPISSIGLKRPSLNSQWPIPCAYTNQRRAEIGTTRYNNQFGVMARYI